MRKPDCDDRFSTKSRGDVNATSKESRDGTKKREGTGEVTISVLNPRDDGGR